MRTIARSAIVLTIGAAWLLAACAGHRSASDLKEQIAAAFGGKSFHQIEALRYTFNARIGDKQIQRVWEWHPQGDRVVFKGSPEQGGTVDYARGDLEDNTSQAIKQVDAWFINDNYWLLFPLRVNWDPTVSVSESAGEQPLPIGSGAARHVTVSFPPAGGYTPGDVYELFLGDDLLIRQWIYRKGGSPEPTRATTWEDYRPCGPLTLARDHRSADGGFRVWFTDMAVKLKGASAWQTAE